MGTTAIVRQMANTPAASQPVTPESEPADVPEPDPVSVTGSHSSRS